MYENDGPLMRLARRAATRPLDPEGKECGCRGNAKSLLCDQVPGRPVGHAIVLDHRVPPCFGGTLPCRLDSCKKPPYTRSKRGPAAAGQLQPVLGGQLQVDEHCLVLVDEQDERLVRRFEDPCQKLVLRILAVVELRMNSRSLLEEGQLEAVALQFEPHSQNFAVW